MSLKAFHLFFIVAVMLFSGAVAAWGVRDYFLVGSASSLAIGVVSLVLGALAIPYSGWFLRKFKDQGYL